MPSSAAVHLSLQIPLSPSHWVKISLICCTEFAKCKYTFVMTCWKMWLCYKKITKTTQLKEENWKKTISCLNNPINSVVAFVIVRVMIFIVYKLYMYLRTHCSNTPRSRIEPKVLGKILLPPELSDQGNTVNIKINTSTSSETLAVTPEAISWQGNPQVTTENPR